MPPKREVILSVADKRPLEAHAGVMPAERSALWMLARVAAVSGEVGEVDAPDERDSPVDDHELLVMTVHRPFLGIEPDPDACSAHELVPHRAHLPTIGMEKRQRRARPGKEAHVDRLRRSRERVPKRRPIRAELELRAEKPSRDVNVRLRLRNLRCDPGQRLGAIDEQLGGHAVTRRKGTGFRPAARALERARLTVPTQPPAVMVYDEPLDPIPERRVDALDRQRPPFGGGATAPGGTSITVGCGGGAE